MSRHRKAYQRLATSAPTIPLASAGLGEPIRETLTLLSSRATDALVEAARDISAESRLMELLVRLEFGADGEMGVILEAIPRNEACEFKELAD